MKATDYFNNAFQPERVLLYGDPGSGKTQLISGLAEKYNLLWFNLDNGIKTLMKLPKEHLERIDIISLPDMHQYPIALETMLKVLLFVECKICSTHGKVNCPVCGKNPEAFVDVVNLSKLPKDTIVVVDNITQISTSVVSQLMKGKADEYKFEFDEWRLLGAWLSRILSAIQQSPCHIICTAHVTEDDPDSARKKLVPKFGTREFSTKSGGPFDHILFMEKEGNKHKAFSSSTARPNLICRSRTDFQIEKLETMSLIPIFDGAETIKAINDSLKEKALAAKPVGTPGVSVKKVGNMMSMLSKK